eukprot:CCRYP_017095-RA/>CCRYP_017095-RA protein AED:0.03 eAED:0.03 QI:724/1/1/1/0.5/0.4/5/67/214
MLCAIICIGIGSSQGGCHAYSYSVPQYSYNSYGIQYSSNSNSYSYSNPGACGLLVMGCLMLIPALVLLFLPFCFKKHHVYLDVKTSLRKGFFARSTTHDFRFKKIGFEHATYNNAAFDDIHLVNYVYGTLGNHGNEAMSRYHLLSHFHQVDFANPIAPFHADDSLRNIVAAATAERITPSVVVDSMYSRAADISSTTQNTNGHHRKRQQINVSV